MIGKILDFLFFSFLSSLLGFITTLYLARSLSQEDMGIIGLYMAILFIAPQLISFASSGLVAIKKVQLPYEKFLIFSKSYLTFGIINFIIIFTFSLIFTFFITQYTKLYFYLPIIAFLSFLVSFHQAELIQDGKSKTYGLYSTVLVSLNLLFTYLFIAFFHMTWDGRLIALTLGQTVLIVLMYKNTFGTLQKFSFHIDMQAFKEYMLFGLPLLAGLIAGWILNQADNYIVLTFFSLKEVGIYTVAYSMGRVINTLNQSVTNVIVPLLYEHLQKKEGHKIVRKMNLFYSTAILSIAIIFGFGAYWFLPLLFGPHYAKSADIVLFIAIAFAFNGIYRITGSVIAFYKQNKLQMKIIYIAAITNIVISILLIPQFGILSPAIGTLLSYMLLAYLSYSYGWRILKEQEKW